MRALAIAVLLVAFAAPAQAAMNVVTSALAHECYEDALKANGTGADVCGKALDNTQMSDRDKTATLVNRGIIYNAGRQLTPAIADFDAALKIDPNFAEAYLNRGNSYFFQRQFDKALADYTKAIDLKVKELDYAYFNRALVYQSLKQYVLAQADLKAAIAVHPGFKAASDQLAVIDKLIAANPPAVGAPSTDATQGAPASSAAPAESSQPATPGAPASTSP